MSQIGRLYSQAKPASPPLHGSVPPTTQAKAKKDSIHISGTPASEKASELVFLPQAAPSGCVSKDSIKQDAMSDSADDHCAGYGDSPGVFNTIIP